MADLHDRVENDLTLHPPKNPDIAAAMDGVRARFKDLAHDMIDAVPAGRELSTALTKIEEACFHAIAGIARNQDAVEQRHQTPDAPA